MTTKPINLAKECGASCGIRTTTFRNADLEVFYAKVQAQTLRGFKENVRGLLRDPINNIIGYASCNAIQQELDRMANELDPLNPEELLK